MKDEQKKKRKRDRTSGMQGRKRYRKPWAGWQTPSSKRATPLKRKWRPGSSNTQKKKTWKRSKRKKKRKMLLEFEKKTERKPLISKLRKKMTKKHSKSNRIKSISKWSLIRMNSIKRIRLKKMKEIKRKWRTWWCSRKFKWESYPHPHLRAVWFRA